MKRPMRVAIVLLVQLILYSSSAYLAQAMQWPGPSTSLSTGYGWREHPIEKELADITVDEANLNTKFAVGLSIWNQRATLQFHNGIDIRGSNKLKAVENDKIRYIVLKTQDLKDGIITVRSEGVSVNGNRILGYSWGYLHLANSTNPDWEELGLSAAEMARHLGVNTSSIVRALERVEREAEEGKA
jgi:hypothetical protein